MKTDEQLLMGDLETYKQMYNEVCQERDGLMSELGEEKFQNTILAQKCSDLADELEDAYDKINALKDDLHNSETECDNIKGKLKVFGDQWQPSKQKQIDELAEKLNESVWLGHTLLEDYHDLIRICTAIYKWRKESIKEMINQSTGGNDFEKFKNHLGV